MMMIVMMMIPFIDYDDDDYDVIIDDDNDDDNDDDDDDDDEDDNLVQVNYWVDLSQKVFFFVQNLLWQLNSVILWQNWSKMLLVVEAPKAHYTNMFSTRLVLLLLT